MLVPQQGRLDARAGRERTAGIPHDDAPKSLAGSQFKKDVEALVAGVVEKHDVIATKVNEPTDGALKGAADRMDEIEKKFKLGGGWGDTEEGTKAAQAFRA